MYKVGLVGAGGAGQKRAAAIVQAVDTELVLICDADQTAAAALAAKTGAKVSISWEDLIASDLDIVVVSTTHDVLAMISIAALTAGKHVLCEKPLGRSPEEVQAVVNAATSHGMHCRAGYNHRFHPAIAKLRQVYLAGILGPLDFIRGRYGHGGRPGYEREWRGNVNKAGGGELLDQGAHLVDLSAWFLGQFSQVTGYVETRFWEISPLEDNAFGLWRTAQGQVASLHASWTQWKNLFSFELVGRDGYARAEGLGGSYGLEHAVVGRRQPAGGVPVEERFDYPEEDQSWQLEWMDFVRVISGQKGDGADASTALATIEWIYRLYMAAAQNRVIYQNEEPTYSIIIS